jgi:hypothetical protein
MSVVCGGRNFVLSNALEDIPGWSVIRLPDGWSLQFEKRLPVTQDLTRPDRARLILGDALRFDSDAGAGAGRYAVLDWPHVYTDAGALLALYYGECDGRRVVASSPGLAARALTGADLAPDVDFVLEHRSAINYLPMPGAPYAGLRRLFHDQRVDLGRFAVEHRPSGIAPLADDTTALTTLGDELCGFAEELARRTPGTIYLPLTAGLDSRTIAASFVATGVRFEAVTLDYVGKPRSDVTVARAISRRLGVRHHAVRLWGNDKAASDTLLRQTAGGALDWDNTHVFAGGGYRYLRGGDVKIIGCCFEIGRQTSGDHCFAGLDFATATGADVWRRRVGRPGPEALTGYLDEWIAWRRLHPLAMDFAAAYYLDQRLGGWRSTLELGYDLLPGTSLNPANSARIFSAMITPSPADQRSGWLQHQLIRRLAPSLMDFPLNPPKPAPLRRKLRWHVMTGLHGASCAAAAAFALVTDK